MQAETLDPIRDPRWLRFLVRHPDASIFHHPDWLALLKSQYGYKLSAWCIVDHSGAVLAGLPVARIDSWLTGRHLVTLPFSDRCAPLIDPEWEAASAAMHRSIVSKQAQAGIRLQIRAPVGGLEEAVAIPEYLHHRLMLTRDSAKVRGLAKSQIIRGVAKATREGLVTEREVGLSGLSDFYRLHLRTRRRQGMPTQPKSFILGLGTLFSRELGFALVTRINEVPIAAAVFLTFNRTLVYKYGASDERFLKLRPNNQLFATAIEWGCANNFTALDFGRTDHDNSGLAAFKRAWGAEEGPLVYTYLPMSPSARRSWAVRPLRTIIRHTPVTVSRVLGAVLYRHAG